MSKEHKLLNSIIFKV